MKNIFIISLIVIGITLSSIQCLPNYIRGKQFFRNTNFKNVNLNGDPLPPDQYFIQRLSHFDESLKATWRQRYWVNDEFFNGSGPVFIMIGGEGEENPIWMKNGAWHDFAKRFVKF
jgi:hypothetical protein